MKHTGTALVLCVMLFSWLLWPVQVGLTAPPKPRVLMISSYHPNFPTFFEQVNGVKSVLDSRKFDLDIEFMDSKRFYNQENQENFRRSLAYKLAESPPYNAIIVADDNALLFALEQQQSLFAGIPIVFLGVNRLELAAAQNSNPLVTGIVEAVSMHDTVALITQHSPKLATIYVIVDNTSSGLGDLETLRSVSPEFPQVRFKEIDLASLTFADFGQELQTIAPPDAVLLLSAYHDSTGETLDFYQSLQLITANLNAPLYHLWYHGLGDGVLGGKVISHFEQGQQAAQLVQRILDGEPVSGIPVQTESPNRYIFDYVQLQRFGISSAALPTDSLILNQPQSLYARYKYQIWGLVVVFVLLLLFIITLLFNIARRRQFAQQLMASEQKYRTYVASAPYGVFVCDARGQFLDANSAMEGIAGYSRAELRSRRVRNLVAPSSSDDFTRFLADGFDHGCATAEIRCQHPDTGDYLLSVAAAKISATELLAYCNDITRRKLVEDEIKRRNRELRMLNRVIASTAAQIEIPALLDTVCHDMVETFNIPRAVAMQILPDGTHLEIMADCIAVETASLKGTKLPVAHNRLFHQLVDNPVAVVINDVLADPRLADLQVLLAKRQTRSMMLMPLVVGGQPWGALSLASNQVGYFSEADTNLAQSISSQIGSAIAKIHLEAEHRQLEERFHQSQKMEALGRLTGGVAHDFNNILTIVNGFAELAQQRLSTNSPVQPMLENIVRSGQRAARLVEQLLAFSRKQFIEPQVLSLNQVVSEMQQMFVRVIPETVSLSIKPDPLDPYIKIDPGQLEQILLNLVVNARDAMPGGGALDIITGIENLAQPDPGLELAPGDYATLTVSDTGSGITDDVKPHIFEPFFTTKAIGEGTGLGLATLYGIVKQNDGEVVVNSQPGHGTSFTIFLPRVAQPALRNGRYSEPAPTGRRGHETILLVEDDENVRLLAKVSLSEYGYKILEAESSEQALQMVAEASDPIHLLLTDVVMPGYSGPELADRLRKHRPDLKVLFMSGYTDSHIDFGKTDLSSAEFVQKPVLPSVLAQKVRNILE